MCRFWHSETILAGGITLAIVVSLIALAAGPAAAQSGDQQRSAVVSGPGAPAVVGDSLAGSVTASQSVFDVNQTVVDRYDTDDDGAISSSELNVAITDWATAEITTGDLRDVSIAYARSESGGVNLNVTRSAPSTVAPGETANVTLTATETGGSAVTISEQFDVPVDGASITSVTVDGQDVSPLFSHVDERGALVIVQPPSNATVQVTYQVTVNSTAGTTHAISGGAVTGDAEIRTDDAIAVQEQRQTVFEVNQTVVDRYDTDDDGAISSSELNVAITDWATAEITTGDLRDVAIAHARADGGPASMNVTRTVGQGTVAPGETTNVTTTVAGTGTSSMVVTEQFDVPVDGASITSVTVNGEDVSPLFSHVDERGALLVLNPTSNATAEIQYQITVNATAGTTHTITGGAVSGAREVRTNGTIQVENDTTFEGVVAEYNADGNAVISITELGTAAADYVGGLISITELGDVAAAYVRG